MINLIKLTQNFFQTINETNKQNNYNQNTVELSAEKLESEDTLPWYWFGSETQLREDYDYTSKTVSSIETPQNSPDYLPESAIV